MLDAVAPALEALGHFLAVSADPLGGYALLDALAPDAWLPWPGGLERVAAIDRDDYARARDQDLFERPAFGEPEAIGFRHDGQQGLLQARTRERQTDREVELACGFKRIGEIWRIEWVSLALVPWSWDMAIARAHALAECAAGPAAGTDHWLERGYKRTVLREELPLEVDPEARFACQGSGACCNNELQIILPASAQALIDALPWERLAPELVGTRLRPLPGGKMELRTANEPCRFLNEQRQCRIHLALGRPVFGPCSVFPFTFTRTPDGLTVIANGGCGSVRGKLGPPHAERKADLYERYYLSPMKEIPDVFYRTQGEAIAWPAFKAQEALVLACLREKRPLHERLRAAAALLESGLPVQAWSRDRATSEALAGLLAAVTEGRSAPHDGQAALRHTDLREEDLLADILYGFLLSKRGSFRHDLLTAVNLASLLYFLGLSLQMAQGPGPVPPEVWNLIGQIPGHSPGFLRLPEQEGCEPVFGKSLHQAGYTDWLLGFAD